MRDCNTCKHHRQGEHPPTDCQRCLSLSEDGFAALPYWQPMETIEMSDPSPHVEVIELKPVAETGTCRSWCRSCHQKFDVDVARIMGGDETLCCKRCAEWTALEKPQAAPLLPTDAKSRKGIPVASGVLDYFPAAIAEVAKLSKAGNDQHNPGQPLHWSRGKSNDHADTMMRHFLERGTVDTDGVRHSAKMVWRALALLQVEMEAAGAPLARGARL
jgi:hypothetical protein